MSEAEIYFTCPSCGKRLLDQESYDRETVDVGDSWGWEVTHKEQYCLSNEERLEQIKQRVENTTFGHWKIYETDEGTQIGTVDDHPQLKSPAPIVTMSYWAEEPKKRLYIQPNNAEFIANSKHDVVWLIREIERLKSNKKDER